MKNKLSLTFSKFLLVVLATTAVITTQSFAQGGEAPFVKGSNTIGISIGAGVDYGYGTHFGGHYSNHPAIAFSYDHGLINDVGPGTIGIGGVIGFKSASYKYNYYYSANGINGNYKDTYTNFIIGVRGTYHLTLLKDKNNKFDPYGGVTLGFRIFDHHYDNPYYNSSLDNYNSVYPIAGLFVGAKYNFVPNFGAFAELGYDISLVRVGINFNF